MKSARATRQTKKLPTAITISMFDDAESKVGKSVKAQAADFVFAHSKDYHQCPDCHGMTAMLRVREYDANKTQTGESLVQGCDPKRREKIIPETRWDDVARKQVPTGRFNVEHAIQCQRSAGTGFIKKEAKAA